MTEKRHYEAPEMQVYEVQNSEVIAASGDSQTEQLDEENFEW